MKLTLPISQLITPCIVHKIKPYIDTYLINWHSEMDDRYNDKEHIMHVSKPILNIYNPEADFYNAPARNNYCSCHLGMALKGAIIKDYHYVSDKNYKREIIKEKIAKKVKQFRNVGIKNIALENCNYYSYLPYQYVCEPDFIKEVIEENDIGFCFDIAHAIVSSWNMEDTLFNYMKRLPLDRITEIHLSGHGMVGEEARDLHEAPGNNQFEILDKINKTWKDLKDVYVVVEYYRCFETLCEIYKRLKYRY